MPVKRYRTKLVIGFAATSLVLLVSLAVLHTHSKNAVERYKDQLRVQREKLDVGELLPPRVDADKNGASLFNQACFYINYNYDSIIGSNSPAGKRMVAPGKAIAVWQQSEIISRETSGNVTNSWKDLGKELEHYQHGLDLLQQVSTRPQLDFGLNYYNSSASYGHIMAMRHAAILLSAAAIYDLNRGDAASSVTNLHTLLVLVNAWENERMLISQLVRIAIATIASDTQWGVLQATNLTDSELALLQCDWESMQFIQPMEHSFEMDRVRDILSIEELRASSNSLSASYSVLTSSSGSTNSSGLLGTVAGLGQKARHKTVDALWRVSWSYEDEVRTLKGYQVAIESIRQVETNGLFRDALAERDRKIQALGLTNSPDNWLRHKLDDSIMFEFLVEAPESVGSTLDTALSTEASRKITFTAIALKRYELRHGAWPADLKALVPEFLSEIPRDPVDGQPMRYRMNTNGPFVLYSIGSDGKDGGGDVTPMDWSKKTFYWLHGRDWVWPQPANAEEIRKYYENPPK